MKEQKNLVFFFLCLIFIPPLNAVAAVAAARLPTYPRLLCARRGGQQIGKGACLLLLVHVTAHALLAPPPARALISSG